MSAVPARMPARARGFTLLELLVVMSLLSLVMLGMGSALRSMAQVETRVDARLARTDEMRVATDFLRTVLSRVSARKGAPSAAGPGAHFFAGNTNEVWWLGVMPARYGAGGMHHFRLGIEPAGLVLRYQPWRGEALPDWGRAESLLLVAGATALTLGFEDARREPTRWAAQWTVPDAMPQRVALSVRTPAGDWPTVVVNMRRLPGTDPDLSGGPVFGGSRS